MLVSPQLAGLPGWEGKGASALWRRLHGCLYPREPPSCLTQWPWLSLAFQAGPPVWLVACLLTLFQWLGIGPGLPASEREGEGPPEIPCWQLVPGLLGLLALPYEATSGLAGPSRPASSPAAPNSIPLSSPGATEQG